MKIALIIFFAILAVLALSAAGRALIAFLTKGFKPFIGIIMYLVSAHFTIIKHLVTSRSIIYPSVAKKTVHRPE